MSPSREERLARNEVLFRAVNERIEEVVQPGADEEMDFLCECGNERCAEKVPITRDEYERVRADPVHFFVVPGHEILDIESVVREDERYLVVRKHVGEQEIARAHDPRA
jgi:hypothetical protein